MWPTKGDPGYRTGNAPPMAPHPWHLNPAAYQNMSNEQVDWARLAQQWIIMKDTLPQAPPPPQLSIPRQPAPPGAPILEEEGGEAPMDISKDDNNDIDNHLGGNDSWNGNSGNNWQQSHHPPPWNNRPGYWTHKNEGGRFPPPPNNSSNFEHNRGYGSSNFDAMPSGPPHMPPFVRPRHQWEGKNMKIDRRFQNAAHNAPPIIDEDPAPVLDAAKRRTLPPWIREGLEKMEREKQKREEREKADLEREESSRRRLQEEQTALEELEAEKSGIPKRSKFETDSEDESDVKEDEEVGQEEVVVKQPVAEILARPRRRFHDGPLTEIKKPLWADKPSISREDLMLKVRRTMTEVLLEVTNCEIDSVVEETLRKVLSKASAKHQSAKTNVAIASSKTSLGLAMYGSGSEGSSSDSDDDGGAQVSGKGNFHRGRDSGDDSDGELKDIIRQRQQDFVAKEKEIEEAVAEAEEKERKSAALQASAGSESVVSAKETPNNQAVRQVETIKEQPRVDDANGKSSAKIEKTERKQRSLTRSSSSSSSSSNSSRSSRHRKRRKEKRSRHRSKDRKREKKRQRSSSSSRRSRSPRRRDSSRDRERKRRDRSRSRTRRRRSRSSESHRKTRRRSRSRSDSSRRRRRHRSSSSSSSSDRRSKKRR